MLKRRALAAMGLVAILGLLWTQAAQAYVIFGAWQGNSATIDPDPSLPSSFNNAQGFAAKQWNRVNTSDWVFSRQVGSSNDLSYESIDGNLGVLAVTTVFFGGGDIVEADVTYDSAEDWYTGSGTPGANQVDLRSVATHELGHITGLDHTQNSNCPGNNSDATMCPFYRLGSTNVRTLATDDRNGLSANYPQSPALGARVVQHALYPDMGNAQLAGLTEVAFVGRVQSISRSRWNTDGGGRWSATPGGTRPVAYHQIRFLVTETIRGTGVPTITVTVLGASPAGSVDGSLGGHPDHGLGIGDRVLVLAASSSLAWRDGATRPVIRFAGAPSASYALVGTNRFGSLRALVG